MRCRDNNVLPIWVVLIGFLLQKNSFTNSVCYTSIAIVLNDDYMESLDVITGNSIL